MGFGQNCAYGSFFFPFFWGKFFVKNFDKISFINVEICLTGDWCTPLCYWSYYWCNLNMKLDGVIDALFVLFLWCQVLLAVESKGKLSVSLGSFCMCYVVTNASHFLHGYDLIYIFVFADYVITSASHFLHGYDLIYIFVFCWLCDHQSKSLSSWLWLDLHLCLCWLCDHQSKSLSSWLWLDLHLCLLLIMWSPEHHFLHGYDLIYIFV